MEVQKTQMLTKIRGVRDNDVKMLEEVFAAPRLFRKNLHSVEFVVFLGGKTENANILSSFPVTPYASPYEGLFINFLRSRVGCRKNQDPHHPWFYSVLMGSLSESPSGCCL